MDGISHQTGGAMSPQRLDVAICLKRPTLGSSICRNVFGRVLFDTASSPSPENGETQPEAVNTEVATVVNRTLYRALQASMA